MDNPFRLSNCPRCDYPLTGLPAAGVCPECGRAYNDHSAVYLYGDGTARKSTGSKTDGVAGLVVWSIILCAQFWNRGGAMIRNPWFFIGVPSAVFGIVVTLWRSSTDQGSGVTQLKMTAAGIRLGTRSLTGVPYAANDDAPPIPWRKIAEVRVRPVPGGKARIVCSSRPAGQWYLPRTDYIDAVVRCPGDSIDQLETILERWRLDARLGST